MADTCYAAAGRDVPLNLDLTGLAGGAPDAMALPHFWAEVCEWFDSWKELHLTKCR